MGKESFGRRARKGQTAGQSPAIPDFRSLRVAELAGAGRDAHVASEHGTSVSGQASSLCVAEEGSEKVGSEIKVSERRYLFSRRAIVIRKRQGTGAVQKL